MTPHVTESDLGKIEIHRLFATPLASMAVPDAYQLNQALSAEILSRQRHHPSVQHSNVGGWQSAPDICSWQSPAITKLIDWARYFANQLTAINTPNGLAASTLDWHIEGWANINSHGCSNAMHAHPGAFWSLVYWVDDGSEEGDTAPRGGELEFFDPRGILPAIYAPKLRFRIEGCLNAGYTQIVNPVSGRMIAFPSWMQHCVTPYLGRRPRISIALNFSL
ncbi:TIGR02466 family protein [Herbaspirillum seropedicae]|uniref:TIGR02466 family protein n=1 Tax=Herbaspirillum seropedicae TaxID=964 RepID=UPI003F8D03E4